MTIKEQEHINRAIQNIYDIQDAMTYLHERAMAEHTSIHPNYKVLDSELAKAIKAFRQYCKRHNIDIGMFIF